MGNPECPSQRKSLLEAFGIGMSVTVCEATRVDLADHVSVVFPAGAKLTHVTGSDKSPDGRIDPDGWLIVKADSGFEVMLPHAKAQKIMVE